MRENTALTRGMRAALLLLGVVLGMGDGAADADVIMPGDDANAAIKVVDDCLNQLNYFYQPAGATAPPTHEQRLKAVADGDAASARDMLLRRSYQLQADAILRMNGTLDQHPRVVEWRKEFKTVFPDDVVAAMYQKLTPEMRDQFLMAQVKSLDEMDQTLANREKLLISARTQAGNIEAASDMHSAMRTAELELKRIERNLAALPAGDKTADALTKHIASTREKIAKLQPRVDEYQAQEMELLLNRYEPQIAQLEAVPEDQRAGKSFGTTLSRLEFMSHILTWPTRYHAERVKGLQQRLRTLDKERLIAVAEHKKAVEAERNAQWGKPVTALGRPSQVVRAVAACIQANELATADKMLLGTIRDVDPAHPTSTKALVDWAIRKPVPVLEHVVGDCAVVQTASTVGSQAYANILLLNNGGRWVMCSKVGCYGGWANNIASSEQQRGNQLEVESWLTKFHEGVKVVIDHRLVVDRRQVLKTAHCDDSAAPEGEIPATAARLLAAGPGLAPPASVSDAAPRDAAQAAATPAAAVKAYLHADVTNQNDAARAMVTEPFPGSGMSIGQFLQSYGGRNSYYLTRPGAKPLDEKIVGEYAAVIYLDPHVHDPHGNPYRTAFYLARRDGTWKLYPRSTVKDPNASGNQQMNQPADAAPKPSAPPEVVAAFEALDKWVSEPHGQKPAAAPPVARTGNIMASERAKAFAQFLENANKASLDDVKKQLKERSQHDQQLGMQVYNYYSENYLATCIFDPAKLTLEIVKKYDKLLNDPKLKAQIESDDAEAQLKAREELRKREKMQFMTILTLADGEGDIAAVSPERLHRYVEMYVWRLFSEDVDKGIFTEAQMDAVAAATADKMVAWARKNDPSSRAAFSENFGNFYQEARQQVLAPAQADAAKQDDSTPKPQANDSAKPPAQTPPPQQTQDSEEKDKSNPVDDVSQKVDDVKNAADKLRGLFGQ
jgi:hypothetical protein